MKRWFSQLLPHSQFIFYLTAFNLFVVFENPFVSRNILGNIGAIPPEGYSYMYGYTAGFILFVVSLVLHVVNKKQLAWLALSPLIGLAVWYIWMTKTLTLFNDNLLLFNKITLAGLVLSLVVSGYKITLPLHTFSLLYQKIFSLNEFYKTPYLSHGLYASVLFTFFAIQYPANTITYPLQVGSFICPTWFQNCFNWYVLTIDQYLVLTQLLVILLGCSFVFVYLKRYVWAHVFLVIPVIWHTVLVTLLTHNDFYYGHVMLYIVVTNWVLLFLPNKKTTLGWVLVMTYFLSLGSKMTDSWLQGEVFKAMDLGLPIIGKNLEVVFTWVVLFVEGILVWLLFARQYLWRMVSLIVLIGFHVYSIAIIQYLFPFVAIVYLLIVFLPSTYPFAWPNIRWHQILLIGLTLVFIIGQSVSLLIPGDSRLSGEGKRYGLHMFASLKECYITVTDSRDQIIRSEFENRIGYCEPYYQWYPIKRQCDLSNQDLFLTMDLSINNEPYYRIIDSLNVCESHYHPTKHNDWINTDRSQMEIVPHQIIDKQKIL